MTVALEAKLLGRDFGDTTALDELTVSIPGGSITALLGPNGAGKTTLLRLAAGLLAPTRGSIRTLGRDPRDAAIVTRYGWLDDQGPPAWLSLKQLSQLQSEAGPSFSDVNFRDLLDRRQLSPRRTYGSLSKGQRRWVQAALLFASAAPILFLDEPADGLDPEARVELYDLLRDHIARHDAAAVVATHALADIERVADHITLINRGRLLLSADLEVLRARVKEATLQPGEIPPENILACAPDPDGGTIWFAADSSEPFAAGTRHVNLESLYLALIRHGIPTPGRVPLLVSPTLPEDL